MVDSTFVRVRRPYLNEWEYYSNYKKDFGFHYQVCCSMDRPYRLLDFQGPYKGSASDVSIVRETLVPRLRSTKYLLCDKGYKERTCWCPATGRFKNLTPEQQVEYTRITSVRQVNERIIGRIKAWGCTRRRSSQNWKIIDMCVKCVVRLTQLELMNFPLT